MASILQIQANRRNSLKSTGPRTVAGKVVSSMNALKSGVNAKSQIIRGEDPKEFESLKAAYYESLRPARPEEAVFVDAIISADWLLRRLRKTETEIWNRSFENQDEFDERFDNPQEKCRLASAFEVEKDTFHRLQRRIDSTERSLHRAMGALHRLRPDGPSPNPPPEVPSPPAISPSGETTKTQIGFVPSTSAHSAPEARSSLLSSAPISASPRPPIEEPILLGLRHSPLKEIPENAESSL